jgi:serine/threonine-protein kinase
MAPEQVAGDPVDRRTDIYALGCVLYEMLTGVRAFEGTSTVAVMGMQIRDTPLPPRARAPLQPIPRAVEAAVVRAMAKRPERRFESATAMREALEDALRAPDRRRERIRYGAAALLSLVALVGGAGAALSWKRSPSGGADRSAAVSGEVPSAGLSTRLSAATPSLSDSTSNAGNAILDPPPPPPLFHAVDTRTDTVRTGVGFLAEGRRKLGRWAKPDVSRSGKLNSP